ncbi:MAG: DNA polymerase III subunit gamma/tau [Candidatus Kaelpia imicola]|nr:DNA polymerase III subunit gamma/tau [Candidatus Kaelpia imicola]
MSYLALARKWRPQNFDDIVAQDHIVEILKNAIRLNRVSHAYLFAGPRGIGKTTTARVLAKALNCKESFSPAPCLKCGNCLQIKEGSSLDVLEIDGASNRGIDQIRDLRENVKLKPAQSRFKIYIIDEVHMLTEAAFNALLKTLEEPPEHVKFIFATTQPNKVPVTILSRCQRFDFKPFSITAIKEKLIDILTQEKIDFEPEAVLMIAESAGGSLRDGESLLDQLICVAKGGKLKVDMVKDFLGVIETTVLYDLTQSLIKSDVNKSFTILDRLLSDGRDIPIIIESLLSYFRAVLHYKILCSTDFTVGTIAVDLDKVKEQSGQLSREELIFILELLSELQNRAKIVLSPRVLVEVGLLKICSRSKYQIVFNQFLDNDSKERRSVKERVLPLVKPKLQINTLIKKKVTKTSLSQNDNNFKKNDSELKSNNKALSFQEIEEVWRDVVGDLRDTKLYLASYLEGSKVKSFESDSIVVEVKIDFDFQRELIDENDNRRIIEDSISLKSGRKIRLKYLYSKVITVDNKKRIQEILKNPNIKKISKLFNAKVLKVIPRNDEV